MARSKELFAEKIGKEQGAGDKEQGVICDKDWQGGRSKEQGATSKGQGARSYLRQRLARSPTRW